MTNALNKLIEIGGEPFAPPALSKNANPLDKILNLKNGFFALESALRVFPNVSTLQSWSTVEWNSPTLWKSAYGALAVGADCFAEDLFGGQFCLTNGGVVRFDPESASMDFVAEDLEDWAGKVLVDFDGMTGYKTAHAWQAINGRLPPRFRLMPKLPFVVGGTSDLQNLVSIESVRLMKNLGNFAKQIHDLPDGSQIRFEILY